MLIAVQLISCASTGATKNLERGEDPSACDTALPYGSPCEREVAHVISKLVYERDLAVLAAEREREKKEAREAEIVELLDGSGASVGLFELNLNGILWGLAGAAFGAAGATAIVCLKVGC